MKLLFIQQNKEDHQQGCGTVDTKKGNQFPRELLQLQIKVRKGQWKQRILVEWDN